VRLSYESVGRRLPPRIPSEPVSPPFETTVVREDGAIVIYVSGEIDNAACERLRDGGESQQHFWARTVSDSRLSAPRWLDERLRAQMKTASLSRGGYGRSGENATPWTRPTSG
jgi:hypothetical protein